MEPEKTYQHLENLAEQLGISIRYENLAESGLTAKSGLCRIKERYFYIMDISRDLSERVKLLAQCLGRMDLEGVYVVPAIRKILEATRGSRKGEAQKEVPNL